MIIIGHKGAAGYEPENTIRSFKRAIELKVDMIEFDVRICKSGELVVIHDKTTKRTTNKKIYISRSKLDDIKNLDAGMGEKIPTLEETLGFINKRVPVNIELKGKKTAEPTEKAIKKFVQNGWNENDFLISSFYKSELKKIHKINPNLKIGVLAENSIKKRSFFAKKIGAYSFHPQITLVSEELVNELHKKDIKVFVWTVNDKNDIKKMESIGVDGIFSDFPDKTK